MQKRALVLLLSVTLAVAALAVPVSAGGPGDCGLGGGRHAGLEISECLVDVDAAMGTAVNTVVTLRDLGAGDRFQVGLGNGADSGVYAEVTAAGNGYLVSLLQDGDLRVAWVDRRPAAPQHLGHKVRRHHGDKIHPQLDPYSKTALGIELQEHTGAADFGILTDGLVNEAHLNQSIDNTGNGAAVETRTHSQLSP